MYYQSLANQADTKSSRSSDSEDMDRAPYNEAVYYGNLANSADTNNNVS